MNLNDVQTIVKVLAEAICADRLLEVAVGGGNDPHVDFERPCFPDPHDLSFLEDAQQFQLQGRRRVADLIEKDRPSLGLFKKVRAGLSLPR